MTKAAKDADVLASERLGTGKVSRFFMRIFAASFVLALAAHVVFAEWQPIGNLKPDKAEANQFTFSNAHATVVIQVLAPDLVRVRMVPSATLPADHSYAVAKTDWKTSEIQLKDDKNTRIIRTPELEIRVQLAPFRVAFFDAKGQLIFQRL